MKQIPGSHLILRKLQFLYPKKKIHKVMKMYFEDQYKNIVNGYVSNMPRTLTIGAELYPNSNFVQISKKRFFKDGILEESVNPYFPNHTLKIKLKGNRSEFIGFKFEAGKKLKKECSER